jgi:hypothetical protein
VVITNNYHATAAQLVVQGPGASASQNALAQQASSAFSIGELSALSSELARLWKEMVAEMSADERNAVDYAIDLGRVGEAEKAAAYGDGDGAVRALSAIGPETRERGERMALPMLRRITKAPPGGS